MQTLILIDKMWQIVELVAVPPDKAPPLLPRHLLCRSPSQQPLLPAPVPALGCLHRGAGALPA